MILEEIKKEIPLDFNLDEVKEGHTYILYCDLASVPLEVRQEYVKYIEEELNNLGVKVVVLDKNYVKNLDVYEVKE